MASLSRRNSWPWVIDTSKHKSTKDDVTQYGNIPTSTALSDLSSTDCASPRMMDNLTQDSKVNLLGVLGDDITVVNAARVSYGNRITSLQPRDVKLMRYLAKHQHHSPFRHIVLQFHIKCPEFVARQMYKHVVGINTTATNVFQDHAWNEISGRYVELHEFYEPKEWRQKPAKGKSKQGSGGAMDNDKQQEAQAIYQFALTTMEDCYKTLLGMGIAAEQARMVLPMSFMTEFYWTASFQAVMHFVKLRAADDSQKEIRDLAKQIDDLVKNCLPTTHEVWVESQEE